MMPVPNDLTAEEERMFVEHGVQPAGPGMEPTGESNQPVAEPSPHGDRAAPARDEHGRFAPTEPTPVAQPAAADPNAATDPNAPAHPMQPVPPTGFVPHAALHAERTKAQDLARQNAMLIARTNAILAQRQPEAEALPDLATDPVAYVQAIGDRQAQFMEQQREQRHEQQIHSAIEMDEQNFRNYTPDYDAASDHYVQSRAQELLHFHSPQEAQQIMLHEAREMAKQAWQRGIPAAQMVYQMAQARGYRAGQAQTAPLSQQMTPPAVATPFAGLQPAQMPYAQPVSAPVAQPGQITAAQQVAAIRQGQGAARSLSVGAGSAGAAALNAEALLAMSDDEFEQHFGFGNKGANARFAAIG